MSKDIFIFLISAMSLFLYFILAFSIENMFQLKTETYSPTHYTLTTVGGFGTAKKWGGRKLKKHTNSEAKMPNFARLKQPTFDKENLLEQIRQERQKSNAVKNTTISLMRTVSKPKLKIDRPATAQVKMESQSKVSALRREIEALSVKLQDQKVAISAIKTSKKYNRYQELKVMKETYLSELTSLKIKIRSYGHELKKRRNARQMKRNQQKNVHLMNRVVGGRIDKENMMLVETIQDVCLKIQDNKLKLMQQRREKERLIKDIYELQNITGKIYIMDRGEIQESSFQGDEEKRVGEGRENERSQPPPIKEEKEEYVEQYDSKSSNEAPSDEQQEYPFDNSSISKSHSVLHQRNASF